LQDDVAAGLGRRDGHVDSLAGGGLDKIDEGFQKLMIMRKKQINEYMHRLEVIGLSDRRDRMAPSMKMFLEPIV